MSKPLLGLVLGAVLGLIDGVSALAYPGTAEQIWTIIPGSTTKGLVAGVLAGWFARRNRSLLLGVLVGFAASTLFSWLATIGATADGKPVFWEIMIPGMVLGVMVGYATQRFGRAPETAG